MVDKCAVGYQQEGSRCVPAGVSSFAFSTSVGKIDAFTLVRLDHNEHIAIEYPKIVKGIAAVKLIPLKDSKQSASRTMFPLSFRT